MKCKFLFFVSLVIFLSCEQSSNDVIYKDGAQMLLLNHSEYLKNNPIFLEINDTIFENDSNLIKIYSLDNSIKIIGMYYNSGDCNYNDTLYIGSAEKLKEYSRLKCDI